MYYCPECGCEFEKPKKLYETHGLKEPPFEKILVCPDCNSTNFHEKVTTHCRCCGARLPDKSSEYCSESCREKGELLWSKQRKRRKIKTKSPINVILNELNFYNRQNNTDYSYGQYVAIIKPKLEAEKKCTKKKRNI